MTTPTPTVPTDPRELRDEVHSLGWHHQIDLGHGIVTPGRDRSEQKLAALRLPALTDKTVLDVGAWDGYFSFAAERLGASRVVALDSFAWGGAPWGSQRPFQLARAALRSSVEDVYMEVDEISPERPGEFDVVFFLGVLYHLRDPFGAIERVARVTRELLVLETLSDLTLSARPAAAFYPGDSMDGDETNWWGPNAPAVVAMLNEAGFPHVEVVGRRSVASRAAHLARNLGNVVHSRLDPRRSRLGWNYLTTDRLIVHARR